MEDKLEYTPTPYIPPDNVDFSQYTNILFIHSQVETSQFSSYCNVTTYPLVYDSNTSRTSINDFISNFNSINRIAFAFHDPTIIDGIYENHLFLNMEPLFDINESIIDTATNNYLFVKGLIQQFSLSNVDFLACNLLKYTEWKAYFESLQSIGNVIIGASDDNTGNIKYGGDWIMENTTENIKTIYFNETIGEYQYLLDTVSYDNSSIAFAFAALKSDGSVVVWGDSTRGGVLPTSLNNVITISATPVSMAAIKTDGSVYGWGSVGYGGNPPASVTSANSGVVSIISGNRNFAVLKSDGTAVVWGQAVDGGSATYSNVTYIGSSYNTVAGLYSNGTIFSVGAWPGNSNFVGPPSTVTSAGSGVVKLIPNLWSMAALKSNGSVVVWGDIRYGGSLNVNSSLLTSGIVSIHPLQSAFLAIKSDNSIVPWGAGAVLTVPSSVTSANSIVSADKIYNTVDAVAILKSDGSLLVWGNSATGGSAPSSVTSANSNVVEVFVTFYAFAALKSDGSVVAWGDQNWGGNTAYPINVSSYLTSGVVNIHAAQKSFMALKSDGTVYTWGNLYDGGQLGTTSTTTDIIDYSATISACAGLKSDGTVVVWGWSGTGGSLSSTPLSPSGSTLTNVVKIFPAYNTLNQNWPLPIYNEYSIRLNGIRENAFVRNLTSSSSTYLGTLTTRIPNNPQGKTATNYTYTINNNNTDFVIYEQKLYYVGSSNTTAVVQITSTMIDANSSYSKNITRNMLFYHSSSYTPDVDTSPVYIPVPKYLHYVINGQSFPMTYGAIIVNGSAPDGANYYTNNVLYIYTSYSSFTSAYNPQIIAFNDVEDDVVVMPGYKLVIYEHTYTGAEFIADNTNGLETQVWKVATANSGSSCRLYYKGTLIDEIS